MCILNQELIHAVSLFKNKEVAKNPTRKKNIRRIWQLTLLKMSPVKHLFRSVCLCVSVYMWHRERESENEKNWNLTHGTSIKSQQKIVARGISSWTTEFCAKVDTL